MDWTFQKFCLEVGKGRAWSEDVVEKEDGSHARNSAESAPGKFLKSPIYVP